METKKETLQRYRIMWQASKSEWFRKLLLNKAKELKNPASSEKKREK